MSKLLFILASMSACLGFFMAISNMSHGADAMQQLTYANMPFELAIALFAGSAAAQLIWGEAKA